MLLKPDVFWKVADFKELTAAGLPLSLDPLMMRSDGAPKKGTISQHLQSLLNLPISSIKVVIIELAVPQTFLLSISFFLTPSMRMAIDMQVHQTGRAFKIEAHTCNQARDLLSVEDAAHCGRALAALCMMLCVRASDGARASPDAKRPEILLFDGFGSLPSEVQMALTKAFDETGSNFVKKGSRLGVLIIPKDLLTSGKASLSKMLDDMCQGW